jgi:hypothetical protein
VQTKIFKISYNIISTVLTRNEMLEELRLGAFYNNIIVLPFANIVYKVQHNIVLYISAGIDPAWSGGGGGGGGGALPALVTSCVGHVCHPPINLLHDCKVLLDYCIWIVIVVHSSLIIMLLLKLLYLILSLIIFCFIMKNSTPCTPSGQG